MRTKFLLVYLVIFQSGCIFSGPPNNSFFFDRIDKINELEGVYKNLGEKPKIYNNISDDEQDKINPVYLSQLLWPTDRDLDHSLIKTIEVRAESDTTLLVKAFRDTILFKEARFIEGKDFHLRSGRILLNQHIGFYADVFLGPYYERFELGVDREGHGKRRQYVLLAGLGFLIVPAVGGGWEDVRFVRIRK